MTNLQFVRKVGATNYLTRQVARRQVIYRLGYYTATVL
jgi:hypothetical protein